MSRQRRDPRREREQHRVDGEAARPRFDNAVTRSARTRRNPRAEREAATIVTGMRPRIDRQHSERPAAPAVPVSATISAPTILPVLVEAPAFWVLAVADPGSGPLSAHDRQMLGAARRLAGTTGGVVLLADRPIDDAGRAGADRLVVLDVDDHPANRADRVHTVMQAFGARHVLAPESPEGGDLVRRLAAASGEDFFGGIHQLSADRATRTAEARRVDQNARPARFMTIAPDSLAPHSGTLHEARLVAIPRTGTSGAFPPARRLVPRAGQLPLDEADFVVAAGNGVTDFETFGKLASALGATPGASRVVCDAGLMPRSAQVGASGTVLAANCYLALGIAGAPQHLQGIAGCEHVIAVNTDLHAAMIDRARLAIVADAQAVMPALLSLLALESGR